MKRTFYLFLFFPLFYCKAMHIQLEKLGCSSGGDTRRLSTRTPRAALQIPTGSTPDSASTPDSKTGAALRKRIDALEAYPKITRPSEDLDVHALFQKLSTWTLLFSRARRAHRRMEKKSGMNRGKERDMLERMRATLQCEYINLERTLIALASGLYHAAENLRDSDDISINLSQGGAAISKCDTVAHCLRKKLKGTEPDDLARSRAAFRKIFMQSNGTPRIQQLNLAWVTYDRACQLYQDAKSMASCKDAGKSLVRRASVLIKNTSAVGAQESIGEVVLQRLHTAQELAGKACSSYWQLYQAAQDNQHLLVEASKAMQLEELLMNRSQAVKANDEAVLTHDAATSTRNAAIKQALAQTGQTLHELERTQSDSFASLPPILSPNALAALTGTDEKPATPSKLRKASRNVPVSAKKKKKK